MQSARGTRASRDFLVHLTWTEARRHFFVMPVRQDGIAFVDL
jgi:hypothetical protein